MEIIVPDPEALDPAVDRLLAFAGSRRVFAFYGEIGAGKTTFIQAFCRHFGVLDTVTSPTFALLNEYRYIDPASGVPAPIYHLDLYRLRDIQEALDIGIEELLDSGAFCLIEWPALIEPLLPPETVRIKIEITENSTRKVLFL